MSFQNLFKSPPPYLIMKKEKIFILLILVLSGNVIASHISEEIYIFINGNETTLQEALDDDLFKNCWITGGEYTSTMNFGHSGDEIIVNVNGSVKTLQQSINDITIVSPDNIGNSPEEYNQEIIFGHYANEILINVNGEVKNLQEAINDGDFACEEEVEPPTGDVECRYSKFTYYIYCDAGSFWAGCWKTTNVKWDDEFVIEEAIIDTWPKCQGWEPYKTICKEGGRYTKDNYEYFRKGYSMWSSFGSAKFQVCREPVCVDTTWTPQTSDYCEGESFTQTSNCGNTRTAYGTSECNEQVTLTVQKIYPTASPEGRVDITPGQSCLAGCANIVNTYDYGTEVTLVGGSHVSLMFYGWGSDGACAGVYGTCRLTMTEDKYVTAHFGWGWP